MAISLRQPAFVYMKEHTQAAPATRLYVSNICTGTCSMMVSAMSHNQECNQVPAYHLNKPVQLTVNVGPESLIACPALAVPEPSE
jgi:hypothetical protein